MGNSRLGVVTNYRSISHRDALTLKATKGEFELLGIDRRSAPERFGRLLHGIYKACGRGMEENGGSTEETCGVSHKCGNVHHPFATCPALPGEGSESIVRLWIGSV